MLGFLEQMKYGFNLKGSPQLQALVDRAAESRRGPEPRWWEQGVCGVPLGKIDATKSVEILVLSCIDNVLNDRLAGYDVVAGMCGDFKSWVLAHVSDACSGLLQGMEDPRDIAAALSTEDGLAALDRGLLAAESWLAQCGDPLSPVGNAARLVGWGNVQRPGADWEVRVQVQGESNTFTLCPPGGALGESPGMERTIVARDLGGVLPLPAGAAMWGDPGCVEDTNCCMFKSLAFQICAGDANCVTPVLDMAIMIRNEFVANSEAVTLEFPGFHSVDAINACMVPHELASSGHTQFVPLPAVALIPRLGRMRVVIFVFASAEEVPSTGGPVELEQTLVIAPPLLLGGSGCATNVFLVVTAEHMMPVIRGEGTLPLVAAGTYDELAASFGEHDVGFETVPAVGGVAFVRLLTSGLIRLGSSSDREYRLAPPECPFCVGGRSGNLASQKVLGGERHTRKARRRRKALGVGAGGGVSSRWCDYLDDEVNIVDNGLGESSRYVFGSTEMPSLRREEVSTVDNSWADNSWADVLSRLPYEHDDDSHMPALEAESNPAFDGLEADFNADRDDDMPALEDEGLGADFNADSDDDMPALEDEGADTGSDSDNEVDFECDWQGIRFPSDSSSDEEGGIGVCVCDERSESGSSDLLPACRVRADQLGPRAVERFRGPRPGLGPRAVEHFRVQKGGDRKPVASSASPTRRVRTSAISPGRRSVKGHTGEQRIRREDWKWREMLEPKWPGRFEPKELDWMDASRELKGCELKGCDLKAEPVERFTLSPLGVGAMAKVGGRGNRKGPRGRGNQSLRGRGNQSLRGRGNRKKPSSSPVPSARRVHFPTSSDPPEGKVLRRYSVEQRRSREATMNIMDAQEKLECADAALRDVVLWSSRRKVTMEPDVLKTLKGDIERFQEEVDRALAEEKSPRLAADRPEQKGPTLAPKAGGKGQRELLREAVEGSIAAQREGARKAEDQRKLDEGLSKGLFESIAGKPERFDEGGRENLARAPGNTALPLSIARVQGTEAQILAIGNCLDAAEKAPASYSEEHLLGFIARCTEAVELCDSLEQAVAIYQAEKASLWGRAVNANRLGDRFQRLDPELQRQVGDLQVNGGRLGLRAPFDGSDGMPKGTLPPRASASDNACLHHELYDQMKRREVLIIFHQKLGGRQLAVNPGFLIDKTDAVGLPKLKPDGEPSKRAILNLSAKVSGLPEGTPKNKQCVNDTIDRRFGRLEEVTLPTYRDFSRMWLRESTAFPGLEVLLASYDLSRFYPSLDLYAMDCLALGQSVWFPVDGARASLPTECAHMKADGEVDGTRGYRCGGHQREWSYGSRLHAPSGPRDHDGHRSPAHLGDAPA